MKGIGLVFAGGGGKGAYEIGVWKYLHEIGLDQYVKVVSGTSVGALNAALFTGSSYELAEDLWLNIEPKKILTPKNIEPKDIVKWLMLSGISIDNPLLRQMYKTSLYIKSKTLTGINCVEQFLLSKIRDDYLFSREGLISMISEGLNFKYLRKSEISCFVTCLQCPNLEIKRFKLNEYEDDEITKLLLATSAIPVIFQNEEFNGKKYCDGGIPIVGDNVPIKPVYDTGIEYIVVIHLKHDSIIDKKLYSNSKIIEIIPSCDLGNAVTGTLDFTSGGSRKRIEMGYADAKRIMQPLVEMIIMNAKNRRMFEYAQYENDKFEKKKEQLNEVEQSIKQLMSEDGFDDLYFELTKGM